MLKKDNLKSSLSLKLFVIGFLIALLMIPIGMIAVLTNERENRQQDAFYEVSEKWGREQAITGPILTVPYKSETERSVDGRVVTEDIIRYAHFLPESLDIEGSVGPEKRKRGIYEIVLYTSDIKFNGEFLNPNFSEWEINEEDILWSQSFVSVGIPDMRGIKENVRLSWLEDDIDFSPGLKSNDVISSGISAPVDLSERTAGKYAFSFKIKLNGSRDIMFAPVGKTTNVKLMSTWPDPSFQGAFLPENHTITSVGFEANWKVLELNRSFPQKFLGTLPSGGQTMQYDVRKPVSTISQAGAINQSNFGVRLLIPADEYQETVRALKYGIMLLSLTFLVLFFYEAMRGTRVHPLQYILIGLALALFYLLLLSISEYLGFKISYLISALSITGLITLYSKSIFKEWKPALLESLILLFIYGFIFVILQLEDYSLLVGSLGLLLILSIVMYVSRKIDWYNINSK